MKMILIFQPFTTSLTTSASVVQNSNTDRKWLLRHALKSGAEMILLIKDKMLTNMLSLYQVEVFCTSDANGNLILSQKFPYII